MKKALRIILGAFIGAALGLIFPYGVALLNILPFLRHDSPYETVMAYMLLSGILGAIAGGIVAYRIALKKSASQ